MNFYDLQENIPRQISGFKKKYVKVMLFLTEKHKFPVDKICLRRNISNRQIGFNALFPVKENYLTSFSRVRLY